MTSPTQLPIRIFAGAPVTEARGGAALATRPAVATEAASEIRDIADAIADPHFREREVLVDVEDDDLGSIPVHNIVPRLSGTPGVWRHQAPLLGQHTDALLAAAGYAEGDIAQLHADGAVA